jgi:hypothetical protein
MVAEAHRASIVSSSIRSVVASVAVDEDSIYWADSSAGLVLKAARVGGSPTVLASNQDNLEQIAVDKDSVYWTTSDGALARGTPK